MDSGANPRSRQLRLELFTIFHPHNVQVIHRFAIGGFDGYLEFPNVFKQPSVFHSQSAAFFVPIRQVL
jgi:hypothetical protein